jgi:Multiple myeloma tumor-associated
MDLLSSIRKEGSRGGVNFQWSDVTTSQHRENYLGHSLMAPVGRWQKGKDLSWYAKADSSSGTMKQNGQEEVLEEKARERKEEIRRIKEAEEDALARALGLPVAERLGRGTGVNAVEVEEVKRVIKETEIGDEEIEEVGRARGFGDFVGRVGDMEGLDIDIPGDGVPETGGLVRKDVKQKSERDDRRESRSRSRSWSRERRHRKHHNRERSRDRDKERDFDRHHDRDRDRGYERERLRASNDRRRDDGHSHYLPAKESHRRYTSRKTERRSHREDRERRGSREPRARRSRSPRHETRERSRDGPRRSRSPRPDPIGRERDRRRDRDDDRRRR